MKLPLLSKGSAVVSHLPPSGLQPLLHDLVTALAAPTTVLSGTDGDIRPVGAQGAFSGDLRVVARAELSATGSTVEPVSHQQLSADEVEFVAVLRQLGETIPDPTVWIRRRRRVTPSGLTEELQLSNVTTEEVSTGLVVELAADLADIEQVKSGGTVPALPLERTGSGLKVETPQVTARFTAESAEITSSGTTAELRWDLAVPPRGTVTVRWQVEITDSGAAVVVAGGSGTLATVQVTADDRRLAPLVARSVQDLAALRMAAAETPDDTFLAAGSPWYLTLFGRDSIWAARMALPLSVELAAGTLRTLAARQATTVDQDTAAEPGKILHEVRRPISDLAETFLPPVYYGTVDATALWICLLGESRRWGLAPEVVEELLPNLEAALTWLEQHGDSDGDGFLEYVDASGRGLSNQGWKDSGDSVRFADGTIAAGPVALAEVQGYAYQAAREGAEILTAHGRPGAEHWTAYADRLAARFRDTFWAEDALGRFPILALDGDKRQVDAPTSNMGHLPATGILDDTEIAAVAARLVDPSMSSGFGLRTMADTAGGYSPLSYHCGSIWPHDTAIALHGLSSTGRDQEALVLVDGLLAAGAAFDNRYPELFGGFAASDLTSPVPYSASCRPQAWSAASAVVLLRSVLGLEVDVPAGVIRLRPLPGFGAVQVRGLPVLDHLLDVRVDSSGAVSATYDGPLSVKVTTVSTTDR